MAFPTAVNDAKSKKLITTPISESEINEAFKAVQSKDAAGPITNDVLGAFVQYVSQQLGSQDSDSTDMVTQVLDYLQGYDGANKRCTALLSAYDGCDFNWDVAPSNGVSVGYQKGCFGGVNSSYAIMCQVTWD